MTSSAPPRTATATIAGKTAWWRSAVIYQVYIRSFADGNGDGLGDIAGVRAKLDYLADLGVDAIWINPWYPSPMADAGYDVADYRDVDPRFGTLAEAEALLTEAHQHGLRVLLDIVPNHTSDRHPWFQAALRAGPGSPERARYHFRPGRGVAGDEPPNNWLSVFGGPAWARVMESDGRPGEWYLHLFAPEQPDLNWDNPDVAADFETTLRFWFDRGVDGFRIDVANSLVKQAGLPDLAVADARDRRHPHPHWDRDEVHDIFRRWRRIADSYPDPRVFVAEAWVEYPDRLARYVRSDELHTAFNFDFLQAPWNAAAMRASIDRTLAEHAGVGAPPTWVLSNHDVARHLSRLARPQTASHYRSLDDLLGQPADYVVGARRARAATLFMLALPGGAYVYQGEELGLPEVEDLPAEVLDDPTWTRSGHAQRGRDGARVPIPWSGSEAPFGFSPPGAHAAPWLPQPSTWREHTVASLEQDPGSILHLYREALEQRHQHPALGDGTMRWLDAPEGILLFARDPGFIGIVNVSGAPFPLPDGISVILSSGPLTEDGAVPADTTVWLATS
ncbi:MAG TPA: glycoside hydrolase family 13 protein [Acidimicrobiales bacterium]|nr:glycoside hydrolase family 13 protein [Acidimicrobiales bacterium]